jgi:hypothetical protein
VLPIALAATIFSMPPSVLPFKTDFKSFVITPFVFLVVLRLLYSALSLLMRVERQTRIPAAKTALADLFPMLKDARRRRKEDIEFEAYPV